MSNMYTSPDARVAGECSETGSALSWTGQNIHRRSYQRIAPSPINPPMSASQQPLPPDHEPVHRVGRLSRVLEVTGSDWRQNARPLWEGRQHAPPVLPTGRKRLMFLNTGCLAFSYPSSGGILVTYPSLVDLLYLSLNRFEPSYSSLGATEEDKFCDRMRQIGARWWASENDWAAAEFGLRKKTALEEQTWVFGWPADAPGVWMLRYMTPEELPHNFGMLGFAMHMSEKVQMMRSLGAEYIEDPARMAEFGITPPSAAQDPGPGK